MPNANTKKAPAKVSKRVAASGKKHLEGKKPSRLDQLQQLLARDGGASLTEMVDATGWQQHSVRGAMAGQLKKRGLVITSEKVDGVRRYCASTPA